MSASVCRVVWYLLRVIIVLTGAVIGVPLGAIFGLWLCGFNPAIEDYPSVAVRVYVGLWATGGMIGFAFLFWYNFVKPIDQIIRSVCERKHVLS